MLPMFATICTSVSNKPNNFRDDSWSTPTPEEWEIPHFERGGASVTSRQAATKGLAKAFVVTRCSRLHLVAVLSFLCKFQCHYRWPARGDKIILSWSFALISFGFVYLVKKKLAIEPQSLRNCYTILTLRLYSNILFSVNKLKSPEKRQPWMIVSLSIEGELKVDDILAKGKRNDFEQTVTNTIIFVQSAVTLIFF